MIMTWIRLWINLKEFYRATSSYYRTTAVEIDAAVAMTDKEVVDDVNLQIWPLIR